MSTINTSNYTSLFPSRFKLDQFQNQKADVSGAPSTQVPQQNMPPLKPLHEKFIPFSPNGFYPTENEKAEMPDRESGFEQYSGSNSPIRDYPVPPKLASPGGGGFVPGTSSMPTPEEAMAQDKWHSPPGTQEPGGGSQSGSTLYGNISLDLLVSRAEYMKTEYTTSGPNGNKSVSAEFYRKFESGLHIDFSFMKNVQGAEDKLAQLDQGAVDKWQQTASKLLDMNPQDFKDFVDATDLLFNEIEKQLGIGPTGLDGVASFFSDQVNRFLGDVETQMQNMDNNPIGSNFMPAFDGQAPGNGGNKSGGLDIMAALNSIKQSMPEEVKNFLKELMAKLQESQSDMQTKFIDDLMSNIKDKLNVNNEPGKSAPAKLASQTGTGKPGETDPSNSITQAEEAGEKSGVAGSGFGNNESVESSNMHQSGRFQASMYYERRILQYTMMSMQFEPGGSGFSTQA